jgi:intracellular multiplication protein IcmV
MFIFSGLNVKKMSSYEESKKNTAFVFRLFTGLFRMSKKGSEASIEAEEFDEVMAENEITSKDLMKKIKSAKIFAIIYLTLAIALLFYGFYVQYKFSLFSSITVFIFSILMLTYAFKEHVTIYKIRSKKLTCTFAEWLSYVLPSKGKKKGKNKSKSKSLNNSVNKVTTKKT